MELLDTFFWSSWKNWGVLTAKQKQHILQITAWYERVFECESLFSAFLLH